MMEKRLKEEFLSMEIPEMKEDIMKAVKQGNNTRIREKRRIKPAAMIVLAALIAVLAVSAGAAAGGMLKLNSGSRYQFRDDGGNTVRPEGFHLDTEVDAPLSEKALANVAPYVFPSGAMPTLFETREPEAMEEFLDSSMLLPEAITADTSLYRLWALGENGNPVTLYVQAVREDDLSMDVYFRSGSINVITGSDPAYYEYRLPGGIPVNIAVAESRKGGMTGHALYESGGAVYHLAVSGRNTKNVLEKLHTILDTVR